MENIAQGFLYKKVLTNRTKIRIMHLVKSLIPLNERLTNMRHYDEELKQDILTCVKDFWIKYNKNPNAKEVAAIINRPQTTVYRYVLKMAEEGSLNYSNESGISTSQTEKMNNEEVMVALVGSITCGPLSFAEENIIEYFKLPTSLFGRGEFFALQASGDSMINVGIDDGDLVLIRKQNTAEEGEIIVALVDDESTLKRFYRDTKNKRFILHPENEKYDDIIVDNLVIQGIVTKVLKDVV